MADYYCNQKFNWASVSIFDGKVQSCCQAVENSPSLQEIKSHPVGFFNYPQIVEDRKKMLNGEKITGCQQCWNAESNGLVSRRLGLQNKEFLDNVDDANPSSLNIIVSNTCSMTCVYCCKKYSHSWRADLVTNGDYEYHDNQRYTADSRDKILHKLSQKQLETTEFYSTILEQIQNAAPSVKKLMISGGEPFLYNNLFDLLDKINKDSVELTIYTGLGVSTARLTKIISHLLEFKNLTVQVSAENIDQLYEFVRYGNSFDNFKDNIDLLHEHHINLRYGCNISNVSIFNFLDFVDRYGNASTKNLYVDAVYEPAHLAPNVLDDQSKQDFLNRLVNYREYFDTAILEKAVVLPCSDQDRVNSRNFLLEFARRRNLSLEIFPKSFVSWLTK